MICRIAIAAALVVDAGNPVTGPGVGRVSLEISPLSGFTVLDEEEPGSTTKRSALKAKAAAAPPPPPVVLSEFDRLAVLMDQLNAIPHFPSKGYLEAAVYKLRAVAYKEKRVQESDTEEEAVDTEHEVEGDVLKLLEEVAADCNKVLNYETTRRQPLLKKDTDVIPQQAKDIGNELLQLTQDLRGEMLTMKTAADEKVSLLAKRAAAPVTAAPVPEVELPLHMALAQVPVSPAHKLLAEAIEVLTQAQNKEGRVHVAQRKSILAGLQTEAASHSVMDQAKQAKELARQAQAELRRVPLFRRGEPERLAGELAERVVREANEITHEYMASVRSSVADILKALQVAEEVGEQIQKEEQAEAEQASEL
eukprot:CAMPEP_0204259238 /NCGR_PEP_ID=MMETSP0468-20130131/5489_1 /ASSEMBLY_ACC=CAM_ASM_000383 /TAXON_ID=2969 /ORGANISM="Oxyrrhis marina" /LENGTH=364 /DNA_ID=CAMNT_0051233501 /DNA_START=91 /DNA_END=1185 /DNA_ORIENTATION=+